MFDPLITRELDFPLWYPLLNDMVKEHICSLNRTYAIYTLIEIGIRG